MEKEKKTLKTEENSPKKKKKMKKWKKVILIILGVIVVGMAAFTIWQWDNIKAVYYYMTVGSSEDIAKEIEATKKKREEIISEYIDGTVRDFTAEEEQMIISGELSVEEATELIREDFRKSVGKTKGDDKTFGEQSETGGKDNSGEKGKVDAGKRTDSGSASGSKTDSNGNSKPISKPGNKEELDEYIAENIIQLYSYKAYYLGQLGQIEKSAKADYIALPAKDRTMVGKSAIVDKYLGKANALLSECDGKVDAITSELERELGRQNMDKALIDEILSSYEEEKALKKAYYLSLMNE